MASANTTYEQTKVPFYIRAAVGVTSVLDSAGVRLVDLDLEKLKAKAVQDTGFSDWGDPAFLQDMATVLDYAQRNKNASVISKITLRGDMMRRLTNYLKLQNAKKRHPDLITQPLKAPFIIVGLPRTGTTLLQRLMSQDPTSHGPALWELFNPVQVDSPTTDEERRKHADNFEKTVRGTSLTLWSIHPMSTDEADECFFLLPQSSGDLSLHLPIEYLDVFMKRSAIRDYELHKQYFQALHYNKAQRRWVWKSPLHLHKLDDMLTVYPDAQVIWCHRGISHVFASWVSYMALSRKFVLRTVDPKQVARDWLRIWDAGLKAAQQTRDRRPKQQFFDMDYDALVADPLEMVRKIYKHFGMDLSTAAEIKMKDWLERDRQREKIGHRYTLDQFGMTTKDLEDTFGAYVKQYDVALD
ncbi:MAG: sulfotransferase [Anaerolineae bacterium]